VKNSRRSADVWYKYRSTRMTARPNTTCSTFADSGQLFAYGFTYRAWRFS
jgi:hypothetical protein